MHESEVVEVGYFGAGQFIPCDELTAGMVGYITASIKNLEVIPVWVILLLMLRDPCAEALPGYKKVQSDGILWSVSGRWCEVSGSARCAGEASAE